MPGLQAKAHALLTPVVQGIYEEIDKLAESLARDVVGARALVLDQLRPDPIFAMIEDVKRLEAIAEAGEANGGFPDGNPTSEQEARAAAVWDYLRSTLLKTVPTTAAGCQALATFVPGFFDRWGASMATDAPALFKLIARSPLRH